MKQDVKKSIVDFLDKNHDGVTIQELSNSLKISRITVTKYVHELIGEKVIHEKKIGAYRLLSASRIKPVTDEDLLEKLKSRTS